MDTRAALRYDVFTTEPLSGTPAWVVPDADGLSEDRLRAVADELDGGGTAFVLPSGIAECRVRVVSPSATTGGALHATVAAVVHRHEAGGLAPGEHAVETDDGVRDVSVDDDGRVRVGTDDPRVATADLSREQVAEALGVDAAALDVDGLPVAVATAGRPVLVVPVRLLSDLGGAEPDGAAIAALAGEVEADGVAAFTFDTLDSSSAVHGRTWWAGAGEVPGSGEAWAAVGGYLRRYDAFDEVPEPLRVEGGHYLDRPGLADVWARGGLAVGGHATAAVEGEVRVPAVEGDDGIIEG